MALLTMKLYPIKIFQSEISAALKSPESTIRFHKSGRFKRSCSETFHADSGFMGTFTHNFAIGDLQAHRTSAGLQKFFRK